MKEPPIATDRHTFKRFAKTVSLALGIALWSLPIIPIVQHYYGVVVRHRVEKRLRKAGSWPAHTVLTNSFDPAARARGERMALLLTNQSLPWRLSSALTIVAPGAAVPVTALTNVEAWSRARYESNGWAFFTQLLATNQEHFAALHRGVERAPHDFGFDYSPASWQVMSWSLRPDDDPCWKVLDGLEDHRSYLSAAALLAVRQRDDAAALSALEDLMALNESLRDQPAMFAQESRGRGAVAGLDLTWLLLHEVSLDEQQLARLARLWTDAQFICEAVNAFDSDLARFHGALESIARDDHPSPEKFFVGNPETNSVKSVLDAKAEELGISGAIIAWRYLYAEETVAAFAEVRASLSPITRSILERHSASEWKTRSKQLRQDWKGRGTYKLVCEAPMSFFMLATLDRERDALTRATELETQVALARVAIAAERYRVRHGHYADAASDLVPVFLNELPRDWQTGRSLRYIGHGNTFTLCAVGWDGHDNGGSAELLPRFNRYYNVWCGKDAVWLRRATQEEIAQWEQKRPSRNRGRSSRALSSNALTNWPATNVSNPLRTNFPGHQSVLPSLSAQSTN